MARIDLDLAHAYGFDPQRDSDYALRPLRITFEDGGAYALLGPSGCGKTTMLNLISGLLAPSHGTVRFESVDVTAQSPQQRNIAQVFQFPVVYDTMTVAGNLSFPLRNRGVEARVIRARVGRIAELLELSGQLDRRAAGLSADAKQRISLGRGLVRDDVSAVLFDEPLTVIDPQLKWQLRRKLKEIHAELKLTLIYVTHDQVEALTFADRIVVMMQGGIVQVGSASALYERPEHPFVGYFIGSPGMNFLAAADVQGQLVVAGVPVAGASPQKGAFVIGVRPEYVTLATSDAHGALPARVTRVQDLGAYLLVTATVRHAEGSSATIRARISTEVSLPAVGEAVWLSVLGEHSCVYGVAQMQEAERQGAQLHTAQALALPHDTVGAEAVS